MSSVRICATTLTSNLWASNKTTVRVNGLLVEAELESGAFRSVAFTPGDPERFAAGSDNGSVFLFSLRRNRFSVAARIKGDLPVSSMAFVGSKDTLACAAGMTVFLLNLDTCRILAKLRGPHSNKLLQVTTPSCFMPTCVTASSDTLACWTTHPHVAATNVVHAPSNVGFTQIGMSTSHVYALVGTSDVACFTVPSLQEVARVSVAPHAPTCLCVFQSYILVGTKSNSVLFMLPESMIGISAIALPWQHAHVGTHAASVFEDGNHFCCQSSTGKVWFVTTPSSAVTFTLEHPTHDPPSGITVGGNTLCCITSKAKLFLYHLPTAKSHYDLSVRRLEDDPTEKRSPILPFVQLSTSQGKESHSSGGKEEQQAPPPVDASPTKHIPRPVVPLEKVLRDSDWVRVNLVDTSKQTRNEIGIPGPVLLHDAVRTIGGQQPPPAKSDSSKPPIGVKPRAKSSAAAKSKEDPSADEKPSVVLRRMLDQDSRVINAEKLRGMLLKYGIYPERYRPLIWRFLLELPEKRLLAPHFNNLSLKKIHPAVASMMRPFPLPDTRLKIMLERTLSALAYHAPVFSIVHFLPAVVFPFVKLYSSDTQSAVEVILSFFLNWGQEFFTWYPHPPVDILTVVSHLLKNEDAVLWEHLQQTCCDPQVFVWEVLCPIYTEIISRGEWLQVMDHAFSNEPLWLFLFHVRWLCQVRTPLLAMKDFHDIQAFFHRATPIDVNQIIQQTYRLHARCQRNELTEPYHTLRTYDETGYPTSFAVNDCVITSMARELEKIEENEKQVAAMASRTKQIDQQLAQAAMLEDAYVRKQRAMVAAQFDASNTVWEQQVLLEKERQKLRDIEHEARLRGIQQHLNSAQVLEELRSEVKNALTNVNMSEIDREREKMKWDFADRMAAQEMDRLEAAAKMKLSTTVELLQTGHQFPPDQQQPTSAEQQHSNVMTMVPVLSEGSVIAPPAPRPAPPRPTPSPPNNPVDPPEVVPAARSSPQPAAGGVHTATQRQSAGTDQTSSTSEPPSSAASAPLAYFREIQERIKESVSQAQLEQQSRIAQIRGAEKKEASTQSSVTEPDDDDSSESSTDGEQEGGRGECTLVGGGPGSIASTITRAIMRPLEPGKFDLRPPQDPSDTSSSSD